MAWYNYDTLPKWMKTLYCIAPKLFREARSWLSNSPERILLREIYDSLSDMTTEEFSLGGDKHLRDDISDMLGLD